jgi:hypothetical protein
MARQAHKDAADLKKKLEDIERKAKDTASNIQAVVEGTFSSLPWIGSICFFVRSWSRLFDLGSL